MNYEQDIVYFNNPCAPGGKDWLRCKVVQNTDRGVNVQTQTLFGTPPHESFYPAHNVQRVEYNA